MTMPASGSCTCRHSIYCNHECHGRHCDPTEHVCSIEFLPDEGGLTPWGCPDCTPGLGLPHLEGCTELDPVRAAMNGAAMTHPSAPLN
ncbi:MAG TPA: hypothetical protein VFT20_07885 [Candidatus Limnocylindrales bacterium]|nr:hypothetical protein [Candidatus Limnocylindrales bacterium]